MDGPVDLLSGVLKARRAPQSRVAIGNSRAYTWKDFQEHVAGLCAQLAAQPSGRWLLCTESSYAFCVGLFSLWQTGRIAVLPPNQQPESLAEASKSVQGLITDGALRAGRRPVLSPLAVSAPRRRWRTLNLSHVGLELFTSGSTVSAR